MKIFIEGSLGTNSSKIGRKISELTYLNTLNLDDITDQIAIRVSEQSIPLSTDPLIDFIQRLEISYRWVSDKLVVFIDGEMATKRLASGQTSIVSGSFFRMRKMMPERFDFK